MNFNNRIIASINKFRWDALVIWENDLFIIDLIGHLNIEQRLRFDWIKKHSFIFFLVIRCIEGVGAVDRFIKQHLSGF